MSEYVKLLAKNVAVLLLTTKYLRDSQYNTANNMVTVLTQSNELTKPVLNVLRESSMKIDGMTDDDKINVQVIRDDLEYLCRLKGE